MYFEILTILSVTGTIAGHESADPGNFPPSKPEDFSFSPNFGVYFHPPLIKPRSPLTQDYQNIIPYLEMVRSRFSFITLETYSTTSFRLGFTEIFSPIAVAQMNKRDENRLFSYKINNKMRVYLNYYIAPKHEFEAVRQGKFKSAFDHTQQVADLANDIYEGTVEHITLDLLRQNLFNIDGIVEQLMDARNKTNNGRWQYKLGVALPFDRCGELASNLSSSTWQLLSLVDFSLFGILPDESNLIVPVEDYFRCLQRRMETCRKILAQEQGQLELAFLSMWPGKKDQDLVYYWRQINSWVEKSNSKVLMFEAFDNPGRAPQPTAFDALGWWRVDNANKSVDIMSTVTEKWLPRKRERDTVNSFQFKGYQTCSAKMENSNFKNFSSLHEISVAGQEPKDSMFRHSRFIVFVSAQFQHSKLGNAFDETDLMPLLELVRTRFSNIMVAPLTASTEGYGSSAIYIPTAVAKLNRLHYGNSQKVDSNNNEDSDHLRLFFMYDQTGLHLRSTHTNPQASFDLTLQLANQANSIFNRTVQHLALWVRDLANIEQAIAQLKYAAGKTTEGDNASSSFPYKHGIIMGMTYCGGSAPNVLYYLEYLFRFVSFVVFETSVEFTELSILEDDVQSHVQDYQIKMEFCLRKMKKFYPHVEVIFSTQWPDTDVTGKTNMAQFTVVWETMNNWAKKTNTTVLMYEAFDNLARGAKFSPWASLGWWRFEEGCPCATNTSQYKFVEKRVLQGRGSSNPNLDLQSGRETVPVVDSAKINGGNFTNRVVFNQFIHTGADKTTPRFNRHHFVVYYDTFDDGSSYFANETVVDAVVGLVHTRFSKIILKPIQEGNVLYKELHTFVPKSTAQFNRVQKVSGETEGDAAQVILTFNLEWLPLLEGSNGAQVRTSFDTVLQLANEANIIYPGTVKQLVLQHSELNEDNVHFVVEQLKQFQRKAVNAPHTYQIGVLVSSDDCTFFEDELEDSYLLVILPHVKLSIFTYWTTQSDWEVGADETFKTVSQDFTICKQKLLKRFPDLEVGLYTSWSDTDENGKQNMTELVKFWGNMNQFSVNSKTTVILGKAFDSTEAQTGQVHHTGWWRPIGDKATIIKDIGVKKIGGFEEKYQVTQAKNDISLWRLFEVGKRERDCRKFGCNGGTRKDGVRDLLLYKLILLMWVVVIHFGNYLIF